MSGYIMDLRKIVGHRTLIQCAASIIILDDKNRVLLGRRTDNRLWGYSGGSVEIDEKVEDCAAAAMSESCQADELFVLFVRGRGDRLALGGESDLSVRP